MSFEDERDEPAELPEGACPICGRVTCEFLDEDDGPHDAHDGFNDEGGEA